MTKRKDIRNKKYDKFAEWFVAQYGQRPAKVHNEEMLRLSVMDGRISDDLLRRCRIYDVKFNAAYKSWIARESCPGR